MDALTDLKAKGEGMLGLGGPKGTKDGFPTFGPLARAVQAPHACRDSRAGRDIR